MIRADCADHYEDIPMKIYYSLKYISYMNFDYIIKLDETIHILNVKRFLEIVNYETSCHDYIALKGIGNPEHRTDIVSMRFSHSSKVHDTRFKLAGSPIVHIHYAGGPAYILTRKAYTLLQKDYFQSSLYEDYSLGLNMHVSNIKLSKSRIADESVLSDNDTPVETTIRDITLSYPDYYTQICQLYQKIPESQTLVMIMNGGLGNQLFQIAAGMAHCMHYNKKLVIYESARNSRSYYWHSVLSAFQPIVTKQCPLYRKYDEPAFSHSAVPDNGNMLVEGFFQSSKYFPMYKQCLRAMLSFPSDSQDSIQRKYGMIFSSDCVVVHARRGDYIEKTSYHGVLSESYYETANTLMKAFVSKPRFILISDDVDFWSSSPIFKDEDTVVFNESDILTLYLLIHSNHIVMANSSFSWWGAYLSDAKTVLVPEVWFGPAGPKDTADLYEPTWIKITNT
jgi:hypothetical protein